MGKQRSVQFYSYIVTIVGAAFLAANVPKSISPYVIIGLVFLTVLGEFNSVQLSIGQVSPIHAVAAYTYFTAGIEAALWVVVCGKLLHYLSEQYLFKETKRQFHRILFNSFQYGIVLISVHCIFDSLMPLFGSLPELLALVINVLAFSMFFMLINHLLVHFFIWLENDRTLDRQFVLEVLRWDSYIYGFSLIFIVLMIELYRVWGMLGFLFFYIPLLIVGKGFQSYHHYVMALRELTTLYDVATILWSTLDREEVVKRVANAVEQLINADLIRVYLVVEAVGQYCLASVLGKYSGLEQVATCYSLNAGLTGEALHTQKTVILRGGEHLAEYEDQFSSFETAVVAPMVHRGKVWGAIALNCTRADALEDNDIRLLEMLAHYSAIAVCNAVMFSEARRRTIIDKLTGVYNYYYFSLKLVDTIEASKRSGEPFSIIMIDIDRFKAINDKFGHESGNEVLASLAEVLKSHVRESDIAARFGGEEFVVILPGTSKQTAAEVAERLRQAVSDSVFTVRSRTVSAKVTISLGVATYPDDAVNQHELVDAADRALYDLAKNLGRNRVGVA